jgi:AraC family transcriptional activator of tynA and feaB
MEDHRLTTGLHRFSVGRPSRTVFQTLRTDDVRPKERFDFWREMVIRGADLERSSMDPPPAFAGWVTSLGTPTGEFHHAGSEPYAARRLPRHIRRDGSEELALFLVQSGTIRRRHEGDRDVHALPGDFFLFDAARESQVVFSRCQLIQIDIPRDRLSAAVGDVPAASRVTDALRVSTLATLLRTQLNLLPKILGDLSATESALALQATEALAVTVLGGAFRGNAGVSVAEDAANTRAHGLFLAACRFIDGELAHPNLDAAMVAHALDCSRSSLYRAFAIRNRSVGEYIRRARLERLRDLLEQSIPEQTVGELAARCGLYDTPNVSRMFRAEFAITPSEARYRPPAAGTE